MTLRIQRASEGAVVVFAVSGRIEGEQLEQLQGLLATETGGPRIVLDLEQVELVDRDAVRFLARCVADGVTLERCPGYIREWITRQRHEQ